MAPNTRIGIASSFDDDSGIVEPRRVIGDEDQGASSFISERLINTLSVSVLDPGGSGDKSNEAGSPSTSKDKYYGNNLEEDSPNHDEDITYFVYKKAVVEIPINLEAPLSISTTSTANPITSPPNSSDEGNAMSPPFPPAMNQTASVSMNCSSAPASSYPNRRWKASVSGNSLVVGKNGSTTGSGNLSYRLNSQSEMQGGFQLGGKKQATQIHLGASWLHQQKDGINETINNSPALKNNRSGISSGTTAAKTGTSSNGNRTSVGVTMTPHNWNLNGITLSSKKILDPWCIESRFMIRSLFSTTSKSGNKQVEGCDLFSLYCTSLTSHRIRLGLGLGLRPGWPSQLLSTMQDGSDNIQKKSTKAGSATNTSCFSNPWISLNVEPKLSSTRSHRATFACQWRGALKLGVIWTQSISTCTSLGIGLWHLSNRGWNWVFSWNQGDTTIRIPIWIGGANVVAAATSTSSGGSAITTITFWKDYVVYPLQGFYCAMLSMWIQHIISQIFEGQNLDVAEQERRFLEEKRILLEQAKAKSDAEQQRNLMEIQSKNKLRLELKKRDEGKGEGLIIQAATYQVQDGDSWDVKIQLQFWVENSSLSLPSTSKQYLLGFYDVTLSKQLQSRKSKTYNNFSSTDNNKNTSLTKKESWWKEFITPRKHHHQKNRLDNIPTLTIRYEFAGETYQITIHDKEAVTLPSPQATLVSP